MSEHQQKANKNKEWYKRWWGLVIAILFFPYFLVWYAWAKSKWSKNLKIAVTVVVAVVILPFLIAPASTDTTQQTADTNDDQPEVSQQQKSEDKPEPKDEKTLEDKVEEAIDNLDEDTKRILAATSSEGYQGDIIGVEPAVGSDTVKIRVSTYFDDSGDGLYGGRSIAHKIFAYICRDVPELGSLYVVGGSGLESRSVYRSQIPACKQGD
jgi:hypothetical protein